MVENDFLKIVQKNADAMLVLDTTGVIQYVNPAGIELFNMSEQEMMGKLLGFPLILRESVDLYVLRGFREYVAVEMRMVEVEWKGMPSYLISLRDMTWRVKYEEELNRSRDELEVLVKARTAELLTTNQRLVEANEKLAVEIESKETVVEELRVENEERATAEEELRTEIEQRETIEKSLEESKNQAELYLDLMAHDIRNLNQIGIGYLELMADSSDPDEIKELLKKPLEAMISTSQLIDNVKKLKDLTTIETKKESYKPVNLCSILPGMKRQFTDANNRDIRINIDLPPICFVTANDLLGEVFTNLIGNAIKHSDPDKSLSIDINVKQIKESQKNYYRCTVTDNGPGVPDYLKDKIFGRFQKGNTKAHGKGIGLYLVRTLVEGYHGKVWVEDRVPGDYTKGVRFVVMLPAVDN